MLNNSYRTTSLVLGRTRTIIEAITVLGLFNTAIRENNRAVTTCLFGIEVK